MIEVSQVTRVTAATSLKMGLFSPFMHVPHSTSAEFMPVVFWTVLLRPHCIFIFPKCLIQFLTPYFILNASGFDNDATVKLDLTIRSKASHRIQYMFDFLIEAELLENMGYEVDVMIVHKAVWGSESAEYIF